MKVSSHLQLLLLLADFLFPGFFLLSVRRTDRPHYTDMISSSTGSTCSSVSNHWLIRLTSVSEESQTLSPTTKTSSCSSAPEPQTPTAPVFHEQPKGDAGELFLYKYPCGRWSSTGVSWSCYLLLIIVML